MDSNLKQTMDSNLKQTMDSNLKQAMGMVMQLTYVSPYEVPQTYYEQPLTTNSYLQTRELLLQTETNRNNILEKTYSLINQRAADFQLLQNEKGERIFDQNEIQQKYQFHFN